MTASLLHIEDNEDDQVLLREYLAGCDAEFQIQSVASIGAAVTSVQQGSVDLILADLHLPDSTGMQTFQALQREAPDVPIVLLTGRNDDEFALNLLGLGAQDYLPKEDLTRRNLLRAIRYALERNRNAQVLKGLLNDQRQKQLEIRRAEKHFRLVVEMVPNAMIVVEADGRIGLLNSQTEKLFGYHRGELINKPVELLLAPRSRSSHATLLTPLAAPSPTSQETEIFGLHKDGTEVPIEIASSPLSSPEGQFMLVSIVDATAKKRRETELKRAIDEKLALLREVHHRSKNNLQMISALLSLQANSLNEPNAAAKLFDIQQRLVSMAIIHDQLFRVDDASDVDLADYIRQLTANLFSAYRNRSFITHRLDLSSERLAEEQAVPCGLLLNELITNALKHAYPGGGAGEIAIRLSRADDGRLCICVSDQGVGLPPGFDRESSTSLGMTLISLLAQQLGGTVEFDTANGVSVTVQFAAAPPRRARGAGC